MINNFWLVTKPNEHSTLNDVLFETDARGVALQVMGGLTPDEIVGMYTDFEEAFDTAFEAMVDAGCDPENAL